MTLTELFVSEDVIDEAGQGSGRLGSDYSDAAHQGAVHRALHETEDMLNKTMRMRPLTIAAFLFVSQRMVLVSFLANNGIHAILDAHILLVLVSGIKP